MARVDYVKKAPYIEPTAAVASALLRFNDSPFTSASYQAIVDASSEVYAPKDVDPAQSVQLTRAYDQQDRRLIRLAWMDRHLQGFDWEDWRAQKKLAKHKSINYLMTNEGVVAEVSRLKKLGNGKGSLSRADTIRFTELKAGHLVTPLVGPRKNPQVVIVPAAHLFLPPIARLPRVPASTYATKATVSRTQQNKVKKRAKKKSPIIANDPQKSGTLSFPEAEGAFVGQSAGSNTSHTSTSNPTRRARPPKIEESDEDLREPPLLPISKRAALSDSDEDLPELPVTSFVKRSISSPEKRRKASSYVDAQARSLEKVAAPDSEDSDVEFISTTSAVTSKLLKGVDKVGPSTTTSRALQPVASPSRAANTINAKRNAKDKES